MPNYSITVNSKFRPFEYQEMIQPVLVAEQAHREVEDAYTDLSTKAGIWENLANEQTDPRAYSMYSNYAKDLQAQADDLAQHGLNPTSRRSMMDMKRRYSTDIVPIENAYNTRLEQIKEQRAARAKDPTMLFERDAATTSLDKYLENPTLGYDQYSGALLTQQVSSAASALSKEARDSIEGRRKLRQLLPYQYEIIEQQGFTREAVEKAILEDPNADEILVGIVGKAVQSSPVARWRNNVDNLRRAYDYARQGLWSAVGQTNYNTITDQWGLFKAEHPELFNKDNGLLNNPARISPNYNTRVVATTKEEDIAEEMRKRDYMKYFERTKRGNWRLNKEGQELLKASVQLHSFGTYALRGENLDAARFKQFLLDSGLEGLANGNSAGPNQSKVVDRLMSLADQKPTDIYKDSEYTRTIDHTDYPNIIAALSNAARENKIVVWEMGKDDKGRYALKEGDAQDISKLKQEDIRSAQTVVGMNGNYLEVSLKGEKKKLRVPLSQINAELDNLVNGNLRDANTYSNKMADTTNFPIGSIQRLAVENSFRQEMNAASDNATSAFGTTIIKNQEVEQKRHIPYYGD